MNRGILASASAMKAHQAQLDTLANNLANLNTTGFKKDAIAFAKAMERELMAPAERGYRYVGRLPAGASQTSRFTDNSVGPTVWTGNPLDIALDKPDQFLCVETPFGVRYTRDGGLTINADGELATKSGFPVLDVAGRRITLSNQTTSLAITHDGRVIENDADVALLGVVEGNLTKQGEGLWMGEPTPAQNVSLMVGALEGSNVNAIETMVEMITIMRLFEGAQKAVRTQDELYEKLISSLANR